MGSRNKVEHSSRMGGGWASRPTFVLAREAGDLASGGPPGASFASLRVRFGSSSRSSRLPLFGGHKPVLLLFRLCSCLVIGFHSGDQSPGQHCRQESDWSDTCPGHI